MAWFVVLSSNVNSTTIGNVTASVQQFASTADYTKTVGASPTQVDPKQPSGGYATQAQAQAEANRFNALPADQRSAGGKPLAPSVVPNLPKIAIANPLDALKGIADFFQRLTQASTWLRVAEVVLGLGLIAVGLAKITNTDTKLKAAGKTAVKAMAL